MSGFSAQQASKLYRIGYLSLGSVVAEASRYNAFRAELAALGYVEGKNLVIETRWLDGGKYDQLTELAAQLVDLKVDIIVTGETRGVAQGGVTGPGAGRCLVQSCKSGGPAGAGGHEGDRPITPAGAVGVCGARSV